MSDRALRAGEDPPRARPEREILPPRRPTFLTRCRGPGHDARRRLRVVGTLANRLIQHPERRAVLRTVTAVGVPRLGGSNAVPGHETGRRRVIPRPQRREERAERQTTQKREYSDANRAGEADPGQADRWSGGRGQQAPGGMTEGFGFHLDNGKLAGGVGANNRADPDRRSAPILAARGSTCNIECAGSEHEQQRHDERDPGTAQNATSGRPIGLRTASAARQMPYPNRRGCSGRPQRPR